jgi:hypothetical protein
VAASNPEIRAVTPSEFTLNPGQSVTVMADVFHPDDKVIEGKYTAESGGKSADAPVRVTLVHPVTGTMTFPDSRLKVTPDKDNPARFTVTYAG